MTQDAPQARTRRPPWLLPAFALLGALGFLGCATLGGDPGQPLVPTRHETRTGPFTVFTNNPIPPDGPAVRALQTLERDVAASLGLRVPADVPPVEVYVLRDREAFGDFLRFYYPELPPRRAFFLAQGPKRVVYTFANDRLEEDLRHEGTHALLHAAVGDLPLWLDEGLAEYFEGPDGRQGLNPEHLARLPDDLQGGWRPDLGRLETLKTVREMTPRDYRESWAWVHYLLNEPGNGKPALLAYLKELHAGPETPPSFSDRLDGADAGPDGRMLAHIERVRTGPAPSTSTAAAAEPRVMLQNAPIDPSTRASRRGFFGRFLATFGGRPD